MLVSLLTLGCPEQLSGGYLYHCRLAELAGDHDAEVEFVPVRLWPDPFTLAHGDVLLVDSTAAWLVRRTGPPRRPRRPGRAPRRARPDGIARLYAGADVFVLPSWREPYGTVYGEALAAGLPVSGGGLATCLTSSATESREWSSTRAISRPSPSHSTGWPATICGGPPWRGRRAAEALRCRDGATPRQHSSRPSRS
jgi:hypothetical protein